MFTTFVIGLREGLEASLVVGIIAAFLVRNGDRRSLRAMWAGVLLAVGACFVVGFALSAANQRLPLTARALYEGALSVIAVGGVTYMLVWMKRHSGQLQQGLESMARDALKQRSSNALIVLAFLAVIREGLETAIFMFAILDGSSRVAVGVTGAVGGIAVATALGYGIYRGGVRLNLARFFRVTGVLLVLVAAGLLAASVTEFAEAGIITFGGTPAADLSSFLAPGTLLASLITPFFGIRAVPSYAEVFAWVLYAVPMIWFVLRPLRSRAISPVPA